MTMPKFDEIAVHYQGNTLVNTAKGPDKWREFKLYEGNLYTEQQLEQAYEAGKQAEITELKHQLTTLKGLVSEVEVKYFEFLKEKDVDVRKSHNHNDMYGWNYHTGERAGAVWVHLFMTKLLRAVRL